MVINRTLSRHRRAVVVGLSSALLAPALLVACGPAKQTGAAGDAASHQAASVTPSPSASASASTSASSSPSPDDPGSTDGSPSAGKTTRAAKPATGDPATPSPSGAATTPGSAASGSPLGQSAPGTPPAKPGHPPAGSVLHTTASGGRTVALTFDDGPGPATNQVLDLLAQYGAHATFCQIGKNVIADPAATKRILAEGHRLCDHTEDHPQPMHTQAHDKQVAEIGDARDAILAAGGPGTKITWWRAPGGDFTAENVQIASQLGMKSLGWSVDPRDWSRPGVPAIVSTIEQNVRPGSVVLMHDGGGDRSQTVAALKQLLPWLVAQGYTFDFPAA
ncbi:hypothetical protein GCM10010441_72070 [Kitasatospora paracochleata]|uniref:Peptidoglycan/xylan/chitin deacetylase (PgdA/CDA1 family) n=1 Tax=Kitasatospora paracochleata TaxID=58354 RepID=A0ABT1J584_9ACTN|nr:polysaccharide deacetylase family protein [Kitasatospora paracochleata]MCP2312585.1 peptidoglycan/xylan/chitin deacetylase (PgdA/CDA1 family) [Kitasatospora paracochleata]